MSYNERFLNALNKSLELGLQVDSDLLPFNNPKRLWSYAHIFFITWGLKCRLI
ncbi:hypothetical protein AFI02nite_41810 [Aliivibrio fischeri]|uniref:Uncharacterized protein n=1 Tax=Aliivibrio fischeri TaxID=668 RepID=A0A510UTJ0_ALIFS|nr:hypothetical protein AFI02nite_41810 [Aliivibrio fischeri]